jgi:hypothetical protein
MVKYECKRSPHIPDYARNGDRGLRRGDFSVLTAENGESEPWKSTFPSNYIRKYGVK